mmetsp:Transcript_143539/g.357695  ORF Transcript_143539/g.357695 Transcript_143539/m.357695 type:complete len:448 (-) Transcript_143539:370-1713(-)
MSLTTTTATSSAKTSSKTVSVPRTSPQWRTMASKWSNFWSTRSTAASKLLSSCWSRSSWGARLCPSSSTHVRTMDSQRIFGICRCNSSITCLAVSSTTGICNSFSLYSASILCKTSSTRERAARAKAAMAFEALSPSLLLALPQREWREVAAMELNTDLVSSSPTPPVHEEAALCETSSCGSRGSSSGLNLCSSPSNSSPKSGVAALGCMHAREKPVFCSWFCSSSSSSSATGSETGTTGAADASGAVCAASIRRRRTDEGSLLLNLDVGVKSWYFEFPSLAHNSGVSVLTSKPKAASKTCLSADGMPCMFNSSWLKERAQDARKTSCISFWHLFNAGLLPPSARQASLVLRRAAAAQLFVSDSARPSKATSATCWTSPCAAATSWIPTIAWIVSLALLCKILETARFAAGAAAGQVAGMATSGTTVAAEAAVCGDGAVVASGAIVV